MSIPSSMTYPTHCIGMVREAVHIACCLTNQDGCVVWFISMRVRTSSLSLPEGIIEQVYWTHDNNIIQTMASAAVQQPGGHSTSFEPLTTQLKGTAASQTEKHHVHTALNYYKDPGDGSPPPPSYVGKPETYERPYEPLDVTINDIRGEEGEYTLDKNGFQIFRRESVEKDFVDDEQIKAQYYPETEQLLKDALVLPKPFLLVMFWLT